VKVLDFGSNNYQYQISFKFDCLSPDLIRGWVEDFLVGKRRFGNATKEVATNLTALTGGDGTANAPFFQMKAGPDRIILWVGWHYPYEQWQAWRTLLLSEVSVRLQTMPRELILNLSSQYSIGIPADKLKPNDQIPELEPALAFFRQFIPKELFKRVNPWLAFGDETGTETLGWYVTPMTSPDVQVITFYLTRNVLDKSGGLENNLLAHATRSDRLCEGFSGGYLSLLIKS